MVVRPRRPERDDFQVEPQAPFTQDGRQAQLAVNIVGLVAPQHPRLVHVAVNVHFKVAAIEALVAVQVENDVLMLGRLHESEVLAVRAEPVVEDHRHALRRAVGPDRLVAAQIVGLEQIGGHVPARFVEQFDPV